MATQTFPRIALCLATCLAATAWADPRIEPSRIRTDTITRDVIFAPDGRFKAVEPTPRDFAVVVLENRYLQVIVCPALGERIVNVIDKTTGRAFLYEGIIRHSGSAYSGGGGSGGGLHVNHPLYHGGSGYVAPLPYTAEVIDDGTAVFTLAYTSYPHLQHTIWQIRLHPDEAAFRCTYHFENLAPYPMGFNPWINSAYPLRDDAQFVLPTDWIAGHWFGINPIGGDGDWGHHLRPWPVGEDGRDQSYVANRQWSAAFACGLTGGYAGICFHDRDDGMARVFDPEAMPGAKAAGAWSPEGWLEIWGAFTHNMEDPRWIGPHETSAAEDIWFPFRGIGGMTWANAQGALNLRRTGDELLCGVYVLRDHGMGAIRLTVDGHPLIQAAVPLSPDNPFARTLAIPAEADEVRLTILDAAGRMLMDRQVFFSDRPTRQLDLPETPWHLKNPTTQARWQEAFTPLMGWGPWYHPPTTYRKALEHDPEDHEAMLGLARSLIKEADADYFRRGRRAPAPDVHYAEAAELLGRLLVAPDRDPRADHLMALLQFRMGEPAQAGETYARLEDTAHDTALAHYHKALIAARAGTWPAALAAAQQAVAMAPDSTLPRLMLATALLMTESPDAVAPVLRPLLDRNPGDLHALALLQRAAEAAGDAAQAAALTRERNRLAALAPVQAEAAQVALDALASGRDLDPLAVDTTRGADTPPGRDPETAGVSANRQTLTLLLNAGAGPRVTDTRGMRPTVGTWGWVGELLDLFASRIPAGPAPLYRFDFSIDPLSAGWIPETETAQDAWREREDATGGRCLDVSGGLWKSPTVQLERHTLYALRFRARGAGAAYVEIRSYDAAGEPILGSVCLSSYPSEDDWLDHEFAVMTPYQLPDGGSCIAFWPIQGETLIDHVSLTPIGREEALAIADRAYAELPPLDVTLAPDRWYNLPRTLMALHSGRPLCIAVLGDSVANDFANSLFHTQVERAYPGARITVINAVAGSATAGYYLEGDRLREAALVHNPDLILFTGAHLGRNAAVFRHLSRRIQDESEAEMLVFTAQHVYRPWLGRPMHEWDALEQASREDGYCIFNVSEHWERYVDASGKPLEWFQRDFIHLNDRARQVGARLAAHFFAPLGTEAQPVGRTGTVRATDTMPAATGANAQPPPVVAEIVGTVVRLGQPITPARAGVYSDAYFHVEYRVDAIVSGTLEAEHALIVHQCLKDRKPLPSATFAVGDRHRMALVHWEEIPGWETVLIAYDEDDGMDAVRYFPVSPTQFRTSGATDGRK